MNRDDHPDLGSRQQVASFDDVRDAVRRVWPVAYAEGSTGTERSWWVRTEGGEARLIGHSWQVRGSDAFWLRVWSPIEELKIIDPYRGEVLYEYDGPRSFVLDLKGEKFLFHNCEDDHETGNLGFLVVHISQRDLDAVVGENVELRPLLDRDPLWLLTCNYHSQILRVELASAQTRLEGLPAPGCGIRPGPVSP